MDEKNGIRQLDIEIKAELLTGGGFWQTKECAEIGLPSVKLSDGPNGMRVQKKRPNHVGLGGSLPATCFPTSSAIACSFDPDLAYAVGERIAEEAAFFGVAMVLGPGLNIKRSPLCGRNFEYYSEDPYLSGKMAAGFVRGVQSKGVTACIKHFAVNGREYARMYCDSRVDEQTLRETYLTGFEIAVKEGGAGAVMTAYNKLNGVYCNCNQKLINGILRGEWGFDGLVVSDWGGSHGRVEALKAGADLEMPACNFSAEEVIGAVKGGTLDERTVDKSVERIYDFARRSQNIIRQSFDAAEHDLFAQKAAEECIVLLKNDNSALPLKRGERVALIGDFAKYPRYQGAGSSQVVPTSLADISGAMRSFGANLAGYERGFKRGGGKSAALSRRAVKLAKSADCIVICMGLDENGEAEGSDRKTLNLNANQTELFKTLAGLGKKIVVVLSCGCAVLTDWDKGADALLLAHLSGQSGARAVVRALYGEVNPCGRLAESFPLKDGCEACAEVYSAHPLKTDCAEGIYVGYKYHDSQNVAVKYPFGYGLSYTSFEYSEFEVGREGVSFTVKNVGDRDGATVAQVYVQAPRANLKVSPYELKLFRKIFLKAGEERGVFLQFDEYSFRMWNEENNRFEAGGRYAVTLNEDSAHPLQAGEVEITPENLPDGCAFAEPCGHKKDYKEYFDSHISPDEPLFERKKGMKALLEMPVADLKYCKGIVAKIFALIAAISGRSKNKIKSSALQWLSVRSLMQFMGLNAAQARGFLLACDGKFFKGVKLMLFKK